MGVLDLRGAAFEARVCTDGNEAGHAVADVSFLNLARILWIERAPAERTLSFQLDPESWLRLAFADAEAFAQADLRCTRIAMGGDQV